MNTAQNTFIPNPSESTNRNRGLVVFLTFLLGIIFFYKDHNLFLSLNEFWTGWEEGENLASGGNMLKGLALSSFWFIGMYLLFLRPGGARFRFDKSLAFLMVFYVGWCSLTVLWSEARGMTIRQLAVLYFLVTFGVGMARHLRIRDIALIAFCIFGSYALIGLLVELGLGTFRPWRDGYRFAGTAHPNAQGACLCVFGLAGICLLKSGIRRRKLVLFSLIFGIGLLILTKSRTSTGGFLFGVSALWFVQSSRKFKLCSFLGISWLLLVGMLGLLFVDINPVQDLEEVVLMGRGEESEALTGRLPIWIEMTNYINQRFWTGYGYQSFWHPDKIEVLSDELNWTFRESHSSFVDGMLTIGFIGTVTLFLIAFKGFLDSRRLYSATQDPGYAFVISLLAFGLINAFMESGMIASSLDTLLLGSCLARIAFWERSAPAARSLFSNMNVNTMLDNLIPPAEPELAQKGGHS
ncbi:O-Antigen ligase [Polystyrenella longa]|uniref:O-Antigen ligase n=1 Tax=Polystyrenella longa TaxID=2528007 RepID=A0A518CQ12_9PLAN|nr:O-antigen ligase family protein [Polystyrenella longa]QDU81309.1 O-Antigen ligase [Polystyrenella longa]